MRKINFNEETIEQIKKFIEDGHTKLETCNKFTLKPDTLSRVMRENNIVPYYANKSHNVIRITKETIDVVCNLFLNTDTRLQDICEQCKLQYWELQNILETNFSKEIIQNRKARLYRKSKLGSNNPMSGKTLYNHHNYKGLVEDGRGYYIVRKPEWYSARKNSNYVFYHSVVMCEYLGISCIPSGYCVHHIDGNKKNNDINNLCLMSLSAHTRLHQLMLKLCKAQRLSDVE